MAVWSRSYGVAGGGLSSRYLESAWRQQASDGGGLTPVVPGNQAAWPWGLYSQNPNLKLGPEGEEQLVMSLERKADLDRECWQQQSWGLGTTLEEWERHCERNDPVLGSLPTGNTFNFP